MTEDWTDVVGVVESSIHRIREHILLSVVCVIVIHYALNWCAVRWNMVSTVIIKTQKSRPRCRVFMRWNRVGFIAGLILSLSLLGRVQ